MQAFVSVNWVLAEEPLDLATELGLEFLDFLLVCCTLGNQALGLGCKVPDFYLCRQQVDMILPRNIGAHEELCLLKCLVSSTEDARHPYRR